MWAALTPFASFSNRGPVPPDTTSVARVLRLRTTVTITTIPKTAIPDTASNPERELGRL